MRRRWRKTTLGSCAPMPLSSGVWRSRPRSGSGSRRNSSETHFRPYEGSQMPIPVFDLLKLVDSQIDPNRAKIHLAGWNGKEHPLDEYLAGRFEEWQRWQSRKNFERQVVLSLIQYQAGDRWLFAGLFDSHGASQHGDLWYYDLR